MMKAAVIEDKGNPVLIREVPDPEPGPEEVVVAVRAAALNHRDVWIQKGLYAGLRYPIIVGSDGAGVVAEVGAEVDRGLVGKEVILNPSHHWGEDERAQSAAFKILGLPENGTLAELVKVKAQYVVSKPAHLTFEEAAALPLAGLTAYRALFKRANLQPKEKLLITGIGGGVASLSLQFAVSQGAEVYVTSSDNNKIQEAKDRGAKGGANYKEEGWVEKLKEQAGNFAVLLDSAGGEGFADLLELAAPGGRIAVYGATRGNLKNLPTRKIFWKQLSILGSTMGSEADFAEMIAYVEQHQLKPIIDHVFPLEEAEAAFRRMDEGEQFGKIIIKVEDEGKMA
ncbi:zinc-binding dehydrogenase [soil metagenome]